MIYLSSVRFFPPAKELKLISNVWADRLKWFDGVRKAAIAELVSLQILPFNHHIIMRPSEISPIILESANERLF
eukprot:10712347-Heterocapsa_arctica.AAC.1